MKISAEKPEERRGVTRRTALGGGLALTLAGCNSMGVQLQGIDVGKTVGLGSAARGRRRWPARRWDRGRFGSE